MSSARRSDASQPPATRRRLSARGLVVQPTAARATGAKATSAQPVQVSIVKWSDANHGIIQVQNGSDDAPLYQFQIVHEGRPSITYGFLQSFRAFLPTYDAELASLDDLETKKGIRIALSGGSIERDPDDIGVKPWRLAMYARTASPESVLEMLSSFVREKAKGLEFSGADMPELKITSQSAALLAAPAPQPWTAEPAGSVHPNPFDAAPPKGRRHLLLQVEKEDTDGMYSIMFLGNTWPFRDAFESAGVTGGYVDGGEKKEYVRCMQGLELCETDKARIASVLGERVLRKHAVFLLDETSGPEDDMVRWLVSQPSVYRR